METVFGSKRAGVRVAIYGMVTTKEMRWLDVEKENAVAARAEIRGCNLPHKTNQGGRGLSSITVRYTSRHR